MECRKHVEAEYQRQGIHMYPTFCPQRVQKDPDGHLTVTAKNSQGKEMALTGMDCVLMATGRKPNSKSLRLVEAGFRCQPKFPLTPLFSSPTTHYPTLSASILPPIHMSPIFCPQRVQKDPDGDLTFIAKSNHRREIALTGMDCELMATGCKPFSEGFGASRAMIVDRLPHFKAKPP